MATITFLRRSDNNNIGSVGSGIAYCTQEKKTRYKNARLISAINCMPETALKDYIETKKRFGKTDGIQFYQAVQSFGSDENISRTLLILLQESGMNAVILGTKF